MRAKNNNHRSASTTQGSTASTCTTQLTDRLSRRTDLPLGGCFAPSSGPGFVRVRQRASHRVYRDAEGRQLIFATTMLSGTARQRSGRGEGRRHRTRSAAEAGLKVLAPLAEDGRVHAANDPLGYLAAGAAGAGGGALLGSNSTVAVPDGTLS